MSQGKQPAPDHRPGDVHISGTETVPRQIDDLLAELSADRFASWYKRRQYRENIENGQPYFNGMGKVQDPDRHSPSRLLQCHRKMTYRELNAPEEAGDPDGIFWFGTKFEEEIALPFLRDAVTGAETFVTNSLWVEYTASTSADDVRIRGSTDPVVVDEDGVPILPTEIKTKSSVEALDRPNRHHRAQLHAYLVGLNEKYDCDLSHGVLVYGARESLNVRVFEVEFDPDFWEETVVGWAADQTQYRLQQSLPPADPEYSWECGFCEYQNRCGQGDIEHRHEGPRGFLPGYDGYPRGKAIEYLEAHPDQVLTPTMARQYPELVDIYGVADWFCTNCESTLDWTEVDNDSTEPLCPRCADDGELSPLSVLIDDTWDQQEGGL